VNVHSLRFKLGLTNALLISLVFVSLGLVRYGTISYRAQKRFDGRLSRDAEIFASCFQCSRDGGIGIVLRESEPSYILAFENLQRYFVITDRSGLPAGRNLYSSYMLQAITSGALDRTLSRRSGFSSVRAPDGRDLRFVSIPMQSQRGMAEFTLHLGRSLDSLHAVLDEYRLVYFYSLPLILVAAGAVGWLLAGRALRPFEYVAGAADRVTSQNLNRFIEIPYTESEVRRLVNAFNEMVKRLNRSFVQLKRVNADTAHELRTPLAVLLSQTELALRSDTLTDEIRVQLSSNLEELQHLIRFVNEILTLSEAEAGVYNLARRPINLKAVVSDLVEHLRVLGEDRGVALELSSAVDLTIEGDEVWVRRALLNVLDNAIKYSRPGGVVGISLERHASGDAIITIRDSGIGISEQDLPRIFERLYRTDEARSRGGSGLGLALVKWVIETHRGKVNVSSRLGEGTEFRIQFPVSAIVARPQLEPAAR
jgi:heavy metal sensor kinase